MTTTPADNNHPHSAYGASGASRWRLCPGSVRVIEEARRTGAIPPASTTDYAEEGTEAHDWAEKVLTGKADLTDIPGEYQQYLLGYINHCRSVEEEAKEPNLKQDTLFCEIMVEKTVPLFFRPQDVSTVDHAVACDKFIHVTDLKYGAGIKVTAEDNDQAQIYAYSLIQELEIMEDAAFADDLPVFLTIYQPRHREFTGDPDTWETTVGKLRDSANWIEQDYQHALTGTGGVNPSEKACLFCAAKGVCTARAEAALADLPDPLNLEDTETDLPPSRKAKQFVADFRATLNPDQIAFICRNGATIKKVIDSVIDGEVERLQAGGEMRGLKLVRGPKAPRTWTDAVEAEKYLRRLLGVEDTYQPRKLISAPKAMEKAKLLGDLSTIGKIKLGLADEDTMRKSKTECLIHRPEGKPKLVAEDADGEPLTFGPVEDDFDMEDE